MQRSEDIAVLLRPPTRRVTDAGAVELYELLNPVAPPLPTPGSDLASAWETISEAA